MEFNIEFSTGGGAMCRRLFSCLGVITPQSAIFPASEKILLLLPNVNFALAVILSDKKGSAKQKKFFYVKKLRH